MNNLSPSSALQSSPQYKALTHHLSHHNKPSQNLTEETLAAFCSPAETLLKNNNSNNSSIEQELITTWQALLAHAANLHHHDASSERKKLAELVLAIQTREPSSEQQNGSTETAEVEGMRLWADLPIFGRELREAWNSSPSRTSHEDHSTRWTNLNAFTATLLQLAHTQSNNKDKPDLSLFALWSIRSALEEGDRKAQPSPGELRAACTWFLYASPALWAFSESGRGFEGKLARAGSAVGEQGEQWKGFSVERWRFWRERLEGLEGEVGGEGEKRMVRRAVEEMGNVEKKGSS